MQSSNGTQCITKENDIIEIAILSVVGDRENQQDSFGISLNQKGGLAVICDGMGGLEGGQLASKIAVNHFINDFAGEADSVPIRHILINSALECDREIADLMSEDGKPMKAGSTCVALAVEGKGLYWCSVGDSRAYLLRGEEFVQITQDQNYGTVLNERLRVGLIDMEQYSAEAVHRDKLISYLGMGNLSLIDYNGDDFYLEGGDRIVLMSDGLYKLVPEADIYEVVSNFKSCTEAVQMLEKKAQKAAKVGNLSRDNMTVAILSIK